MSHPYEPHQQLMAALWPECSDASAPWQRGFSPQSGDNGLSTAAWLAVHRVICRMSVSAESRPVKRGEGGGAAPFAFNWPVAYEILCHMVFTYCNGNIYEDFLLIFFFFFCGVGGESVLKLRKDSPHPLLKILDLANLPPLNL